MKKGLSFTFMNEEIMLLGINYEKINFCTGISRKKEIITEEFHVLTIGIIFATFTVTF